MDTAIPGWRLLQGRMSKFPINLPYLMQYVIDGKHENINLFNLMKNYLTNNSLLFPLYQGPYFEVLLFNF